MRHLLTAFACFFTVSISAQSIYPWNPDSNSDQFIGFTDVLDLLAVYGSEFTPENIFCNSDSTSIIIDQGELSAPQCMMTCKGMPGNCRVMNLSDAGFIWDEIVSDAFAGTYNSFGVWLGGDDENYLNLALRRQDNPYETGIYVGSAPTATGGGYSPARSYQCYCATHERRKVEYDYCFGVDPTNLTFLDCIEEKLAEGWYPLSGWISDFTKQGYGDYEGTPPTSSTYDARIAPVAKSHAAFWRWAE